MDHEFESMNTLRLEPRHLQDDEVNALGASFLARRIRMILRMARSKVLDQSLTYNVRGILTNIMTSGVLALQNGSVEALRYFYITTYSDLLRTPTLKNWQLVEGDFDLKADSYDSISLNKIVDKFDADIAELNYAGQEVISPSNSMAGMGEAGEGNSDTTKKIIQYTIFAGLLYGAWYYTLKQDSKLISKRL